MSQTSMQEKEEHFTKRFVNNTVCFISTVTFHDNVAPKVLKIIQFCKKYLKDNTLAFNVHQFLGLFDKNWTLLSHS